MTDKNMTAPETQGPTVTQAARDAAAAYMEHFRPAGWQNAVAQIPLGNADLGESVQAFARFEAEIRAALAHRSQSEKGEGV